MGSFNENSKEIKNQASSLYETAKGNVVDAYSKTKPEAEKLASKIGQTASDLYNEGESKFLKTESHFEDALKSSIRRKPLTSVLVAAGIGYLYAKLFS